MKRIALTPGLLMAGPAMAHNAPTLHTHDTSILSLVMGLMFIATGISAAFFVRARSK